MFASYKKKNYAWTGKTFPIGNDPEILNNGKLCGVYYEVNNAKEEVQLISKADAAADYRSNEDPESTAGTYVPSVSVKTVMKDGREEMIFPEKWKPFLLDAVIFDRKPKNGYWFALMKFYDDGEKKIPYDKEYSKDHYAVCAFPAKYKETGRKTYIINEDGVVYQRDLQSAEYLDTYPGPDPVSQGWKLH
jgi:hypothetical protein